MHICDYRQRLVNRTKGHIPHSINLLQKTFHHQRAWWYSGSTNSAKPLILWVVEKHHLKMACCQRSSNTVRQPYWKPLHSLLNLCWREGKVHQDKCNAKKINLYETKDNKNNYWSISLLINIGKFFAQVLADHIYSESQCEFGTNRSTIVIIFSLHRLLEWKRNVINNRYIDFIHLKGSSKGLFQLLRKIGCSPTVVVHHHFLSQEHIGSSQLWWWNFPIQSKYKIRMCFSFDFLWHLFHDVELCI